MSFSLHHPVCVVGLGSALPQAVLSQDAALTFARSLLPNLDESQHRQMEAIYRRSAVQTRHIAGESNSALTNLNYYAPSSAVSPLGPTTQQRMQQYHARALPLATAAASAALTDATSTNKHLSPASITHLITATCTGFASPGWELALLTTLALRSDVHRTHLGFMGCHAAINALRLATSIAAADPRAVVLVVCCEICSVHFQYTSRPEHMVANALFADGAAAAVVTQSPRGVAIKSTAAMIAPDSASDMGWHITDHGFAMTLSPNIPPIIERSVKAFIDDLCKHTPHDPLSHYAVHPGGPKILSAFQTGLGLDDAALTPSRAVLASAGNLSSPTVLIILESILIEHRKRFPTLDPWGLPATALVSFGPGVAAEGCLLIGQQG
jgi:predicted naringenin-chalcone synthase